MFEAFKTFAGMGVNALGQIKFDKVVALDDGPGSGNSPVSRLMTVATGINIENLVDNIAYKSEKKEIKVKAKEVVKSKK